MVPTSLHCLTVPMFKVSKNKKQFPNSNLWITFTWIVLVLIFMFLVVFLVWKVLRRDSR